MEKITTVDIINDKLFFYTKMIDMLEYQILIFLAAIEITILFILT